MHSLRDFQLLHFAVNTMDGTAAYHPVSSLWREHVQNSVAVLSALPARRKTLTRRQCQLKTNPKRHRVQRRIRRRSAAGNCTHLPRLAADATAPAPRQTASIMRPQDAIHFIQKLCRLAPVLVRRSSHGAGPGVYIAYSSLALNIG